jgi:hypothetical protein
LSILLNVMRFVFSEDAVSFLHDTDDMIISGGFSFLLHNLFTLVQLGTERTMDGLLSSSARPTRYIRQVRQDKTRRTADVDRLDQVRSRRAGTEFKDGNVASPFPIRAGRYPSTLITRCP